MMCFLCLGLPVAGAYAQNQDSPLEGMDGNKPGDTPPDAKPAPPPEKAPEKVPERRTDGTPDGFRRHVLAGDGFAVALPARWIKVPIRGAVKINYRGGSNSCNVNIIASRFPGSNGRPTLLNSYLATVTSKNVTSQIPATMRPRVVSVTDASLGGQKARRIVIDISPNGGNLRMVQHLTFRTNGVYTLTCGAPQDSFDNPSAQAVFTQVHRSFRFIGN